MVFDCCGIMMNSKTVEGDGVFFLTAETISPNPKPLKKKIDKLSDKLSIQGIGRESESFYGGLRGILTL